MIILDASVVVKWFSEEEYTEKALEIRERIRVGEERVLVPDLLLYELANALKYNPSMDLDIVTPIPEIINSAVTLAFEHNITVYDAFYIALAKEIELTFITADKRLSERVSSLDFVKFIGDLQ